LPRLIFELRLTLVSDCQYQDRVVFRFVAAERYIALFSAGYDQFTQVYPLSIRHHRQLSFDFARLWPGA
jgi:hypothetical protein